MTPKQRIEYVRTLLAYLKREREAAGGIVLAVLLVLLVLLVLPFQSYCNPILTQVAKLTCVLYNVNDIAHTKSN